MFPPQRPRLSPSDPAAPPVPLTAQELTEGYTELNRQYQSDVGWMQQLHAAIQHNATVVERLKEQLSFNVEGITSVRLAHDHKISENKDEVDKLKTMLNSTHGAIDAQVAKLTEEAAVSHLQMAELLKQLPAYEDSAQKHKQQLESQQQQWQQQQQQSQLQWQQQQ